MEVLGDMIRAADGLTVYSTGTDSVGHSESGAAPKCAANALLRFNMSVSYVASYLRCLMLADTCAVSYREIDVAQCRYARRANTAARPYDSKVYKSLIHSLTSTNNRLNLQKKMGCASSKEGEEYSCSPSKGNEQSLTNSTLGVRIPLYEGV